MAALCWSKAWAPIPQAECLPKNLKASYPCIFTSQGARWECQSSTLHPAHGHWHKTVHLQQVKPLIIMRSWQRNSWHHPDLSSSTALHTNTRAYFHPISGTLRYACACNILAGGHANIHSIQYHETLINFCNTSRFAMLILHLSMLIKYTSLFQLMSSW